MTDDEVALVLRRAADLDTAPPSASGLPVEAVEAAAAEVGLSPAAVRHAVAELRAGALDSEQPPGDGVVVCARVVPGGCDGCLLSVERFLKGQALVRARDRGTEQVWRPRDDVLAKVQRGLDLGGTIRLRAITELVVRVVEVEGGTLVRIVARLLPATAAAPTIGAGVGSAVGAAGLGAAGLALGDPAWLLAAAGALTGGAAVGTVGWRAGRTVRAGERRKVAEAVDGFLDELELGRSPSSRKAIDRLAARARRSRRGPYV